MTGPGHRSDIESSLMKCGSKWFIQRESGTPEQETTTSPHSDLWQACASNNEATALPNPFISATLSPSPVPNRQR